MSVRIIVIGSRKGGVNKTTTTVNLGYELCDLGKRVLVIDFDSQADCTKYFRPMNPHDDYYVGDLLLDRKFDINLAVYPALVRGKEQKNLHIIPGRRGDEMSKLEMNMISLPRREERLKRQLEKIQMNYDFILIDTSPSSSVLGLNAVMAATEFLFPTEMKEDSLDGTETLLEHIQDVLFCEEHEIEFKVLPANVNNNAKKSLAYGTEYINTRWPDNTTKTTIWERTLFLESAQTRTPARLVQPSHVAAVYYKDLARELTNDND